MAAREQLPLESIRWNHDTWPRMGLDVTRVAEFLALYVDEGLNALPPVEVVPDAEGSYLIADGHHRVAALKETDAESVPAIVLEPSPGRDPVGFAFERALALASTASKPLTRSEKRAAVDRLIEERPELGDREIARLVGVSHPFVSKRRNRVETFPGEEATNRYLAGVSAEDLASRLFRGLESLWQARELSDLILGDRTGKRLAVALREYHGGNALEWARRFLSWATVAVSDLEKDEDA